jgi:hypothetical protein
VTDWRDLAHRTHRRPRAGAYDKAEARLRGLGGTVAIFARALVRHGRALAAEIDELEAKSPSWSSTLRRCCWRPAGAAR